MPGLLSGRHAVITGGGSGLGSAIALAMAREGAAVTLSGRRREPLESVASSLPKAAIVLADVTVESDIEKLFDEAAKANGPADILVANAGAVESSPLTRTSLEQWQRLLTVNLTGAFLSARAAIPPMLETGWGRIVFVASTAGIKGYPYVAPYCAAKHGIIGLARALAIEVATSGVTVNALCPGFAETPLLGESIRKIMEKTGRDEDSVRRSLRQSNPQDRFVQPEEVAHAALWLCTPGSDAITGQAISISGGEI